MSDLQHAMCVLHQSYITVVSKEAVVIIALLKVSERKCGFLSVSKKPTTTKNQTKQKKNTRVLFMINIMKVLNLEWQFNRIPIKSLKY